MKERVVKVADWAVERGEAVIATYGLGSCVACVIDDPGAGVGGLAHIMLPSPTLAVDRDNAAKFPETAVPLLVEALLKLGAVRARLRARLAGGAAMFAKAASPGIALMGDRNVQATRDALKAAKIPVVAEDVGLDYGRSVALRLPNGTLEIRSVLHGTREL